MGLLLITACGTPLKPEYGAPFLGADQYEALVVEGGALSPGEASGGEFAGSRFVGYQLWASQGMALRISVESVGDRVDPVLMLYGPAPDTNIWGEVRAMADDVGQHRDPRLVTGPLDAGRYLVLVGSWEQARGIPFSIRVDCLANCDARVTPQNTCEGVCHSGFWVDDEGACHCGDECRDDTGCELGWECAQGECFEPTCSCLEGRDPVCGHDGVTYRNACEARCAGVLESAPGECAEVCPELACELSCASGFVLDAQGCELCECQDPCETCPSTYAPVCTENGATVSNRCLAWCTGERIAYTGECERDCDEPACDVECPHGFVRDALGCPTCECVEIEPECVDDGTPVCGADGNTHRSACVAEAAGVRIMLQQACPELCHGDRECPDGYVCRAGVYRLPDCDPAAADCFAVCVLPERECEPTSLAPGCERGDVCTDDGLCETPADCGRDCAEVYIPVCGADGETYGNECRAECAGVEWTAGECCTDVVDCALECPDGLAVSTFGCSVCECAEPATECVCAADFVNPVCGEDGVLYDNECEARCAGVAWSEELTACEEPDGTVTPVRPGGD